MAKSKKNNNTKKHQLIPEWFDCNLPSREQILSCIRNNSNLKIHDLANKLSIQNDYKTVNALEKRISAMFRDEQINIDNLDYISISENNSFLKGKINIKNNATGIFISENGNEKVFINQREMKKVFHGDRVVIKKIYKENQILEGKILEILERCNNEIIGKITKIDNVFILFPIEPKSNNKITLVDKNLEEGRIVSVEILKYPTSYSQAIGVVKDNIGHIEDHNTGAKIAIKKYNINNIFDDNIINDLEYISDYINEDTRSNRVNLTNLPFVTIDDENARDFDDALYCKENINKDGSRSWNVFVAIADVSEYVKPSSNLDKEALKRGTSIYFPNTVVPMLPEKISNNICSLIPNKERLVIVCEFFVSDKIISNKKYTISDYSFYTAIIKSKARLNYKDVDRALFGEDIGISKEIKSSLDNLNSVYNLLLKSRSLRGAIDFEIIENKILYKEDGTVDKITRIERGVANKIVEECMLAANNCAGNFIDMNKYKCLYRIHEKPSFNSIKTLTKFLKIQGINNEYYDLSTSNGINEILKTVKNSDKFTIVQNACLQAMQQALYDFNNIGHFGLCYDTYVHFTSPIRRYPDLFNHRIIKKILIDKATGKIRSKEINSIKDNILLGEEMSFYERKADEASRYANNWVILSHIKKYEKKYFYGIITTILDYGIFANLEHIYVDGMIHISELKKAKLKYEKNKKYFYNKETKKIYKLGDRIKVVIKCVNIEQGQVVLGLD